MTTVEQASPQSTSEKELRSLLRSAHRSWRRAGVRAEDRFRLGDELHAELIASTEAGRSPSTVLGENPVTTMQQWAHEREVAGRSLQIGILVPLTLFSVLIGSSVIITDQVVQSTVPDGDFIQSGAIWLAVLFVSILVSWSAAPLACWAVLHRGGDPRAAGTARWLIALLPLGALLLDIFIAVISGTDGPFIIVMAVATALVFAATPVLARSLAVRYIRSKY